MMRQISEDLKSFRKGVVHAALLELFRHKIPPKSTGIDELVEKHDALILRFLDALLKVTRLAWERPMVVSILTLRLAMLPHSAMPEGQHPRVDGLDVKHVVAKARSDEMLARPMSLAYGNDVLSRCATLVVKMQQDEQKMRRRSPNSKRIFVNSQNCHWSSSPRPATRFWNRSENWP